MLLEPHWGSIVRAVGRAMIESCGWPQKKASLSLILVISDLAGSAKIPNVTQNGSPHVSEYAQAYDRLRGSHEARVRRIATKFGVQKDSVRVSLSYFLLRN